MEATRMIHKNWQELIKPTQLDVRPGADPSRQATVVAEPLERGFGLTLGNALRRVLMSSLQGAAITSVQIDNVLHEFSSVAGVREDVTDIVLNLKGVSLKMEVEGPKRLSISAKGPGVVTAGDISESNGIEVLNKDHVLLHLDDGADVFMELTVNTGKGYVAADKNRPEDAPIGLIPIDAIYSPVKKVSYEVQPTREGQVLDYDKLTMKIETDGSLEQGFANAQVAVMLEQEVWGAGFAAPLFLDDFMVRSQKLVGEKHLKLSLERGYQRFDAIWFNHIDSLPEFVKVAYRLDQNVWNGRISVQLVIEHAEAA